MALKNISHTANAKSAFDPPGAVASAEDMDALVPSETGGCLKAAAARADIVTVLAAVDEAIVLTAEYLCLDHGNNGLGHGK